MDSPRLSDKEWTKSELEAQWFLSHNEQFLNEISRIKQRFDISSWQPNPEQPRLELYPPKEDEEYFFHLVNKICNRITLPGNWFSAVFQIIIGYSSVDNLRPSREVHIAVTDQEEYVQLRIYGNASIVELREAAERLRRVIKRKYSVQKQVRDKPQFGKYRRAYELRRKGYRTPQATEIMNKEYPDEAITPADVSSYDKIMQREIEASFASEAAFYTT